jgi:hypothetical protein
MRELAKARGFYIVRSGETLSSLHGAYIGDLTQNVI